jgi:hypothetical protein
VFEAQSIAHEEEQFPQRFEELLMTTIRGVPAQEWIANRTMEYVRLYYAVAELHDQMGLEFDADKNAFARQFADAMWMQSSEMFEANHISRSSLGLYAINEVKTSSLFEALYDEGGEREVSNDELLREFAREYAHVEIYSTGIPEFAPEDSELSDDEFRVAVRANFAEIMHRVNGGAEFTDAVHEFQIELAGLHGIDTDGMQPPSRDELLWFITKAEREGNQAVGLMSTIFTAPTGRAIEYDMVEEQGSWWFVIRRLDVLQDEELFETHRRTVLTELKTDEFTEWLDAQAAQISPAENSDALNRYRTSALSMSA